MSFTKFASAEILDLKGSRERKPSASLSKIADYHDYRTDDGYMYVRIRAISSRVNKNHDGWPSVELAGGQDAWDVISSRHQGATGFTIEADSKNSFGYSTFLGKPIFVDHHNSNPKRARGVIVDAKLHVEDHHTAGELDPYYSSAPDNHLPPTWVELLLEVDANQFPKLANAIIEGSEDSSKGIDGFSMGCDVDKSRCNVCANVAESPDEYCDHIKMKGQTFNVLDTKTGKVTSKKSYEDCYGIKFFEISGVFDPADETALTREVRHAVHKEGSVRVADNPPPQSDMTKAPDEVNTLRKEQICPVCGQEMDGETCKVCGYTEPPEGFGNPDLTKAEDREDDVVPAPPTDLGEDQGGDQGSEGPPFTKDFNPGQKQPGSLLQARKPGHASNVRSEMAWTPSVHPKVAARINKNERPIQPSQPGGSDEPNDEKITSDQTKPVTSHFQENYMGTTWTRVVAAEPADSSGRADKRVSPEGVGGVIQDTNEQASRADRQVNVDGKGGVYQDSNAEASRPDEEQSVEATSDNAGFDNGGNPGNNSGPTKTWDNSNEPGSAVTDRTPYWTNESDWEKAKSYSSTQHQAYDDRPFPHEKPDLELADQSQAGGAKPADPVGKADERIDLTNAVTSPANNSGETKTWTGTGGNGVTRQQDPVTKNPWPKQTRALFAAFRLADTEVELGLLPKEQKFPRVAALEGEGLETIVAQLETLERVRTAGLKKQATSTPAPRVPSLQRRASSTEPTSSEVLDSALFIN